MSLLFNQLEYEMLSKPETDIICFQMAPVATQTGNKI